MISSFHRLKTGTGVACLAALVCAGSLSIAPPAGASQQPVVLTPTFADNTGDTEDAPAKTAPACSVTFTSLADGRREALLVGAVGDRAVQSPQDVQAWMRAILTGLPRRGINPQYAAASAAGGPASGPTAQFTLRMVWIDASEMDISANVIVAIDATGQNGRALHKVYRGRITKINWAGTSSEIQKDISDAFADSLDKIAPDLKPLCQG